MSNLDMQDVKRRMDASVANYNNELAGLRAGRATTAMLEPVSVDAYGSRMSEDRRKELVKVAGKYAEAARVAVRNIRRDAIEVVRKDEKSSAISEDERHGFEADIQKVTDEFISNIDSLLAEKEKDITQV